MTKSELNDLNLVRTYLGVTTMSDLASALGSHILPCVWSAQPIFDRKKSYDIYTATTTNLLSKRLMETSSQAYLVGLQSMRQVSTSRPARSRDCCIQYAFTVMIRLT